MAYYARHDYTGNGSLKNFSVSFPYIYTTHVDVFVNGVKKTLGTDYSFSNPSTITFVTAPASGAKVVIRRNTPKASKLVDYQDASILTEEILDISSTQLMYITQEQLDTGVESVAIAQAAETKATAAVATANSASDTANTAKATADSAAASAASAVTTANAASSTASTALNTANAASDAASSAVTTATNANLTANSANATAGSAMTSASSALATANSAADVANSAYTTANSAITLAQTADANATEALAISMTAVTQSATAENAAVAAQDAATTAQAEAVAASASAANSQATVTQIQADLEELSIGDVTTFMKKDQNLAGLTDTTLARVNLGLDQVENTADADKPVSAATQTALDGKADVAHGHVLFDVSGLQAALDGKAASVHTHATTDISGLQAVLDGKAASVHTHAVSDVTGLQTALDGKAPTSHSHGIADVTGLQTALDGKAASSHTHDASDITSGVIDVARLPDASTTAQGVVQLTTSTSSTSTTLAATASAVKAAYDLAAGKAAASHSHSYLGYDIGHSAVGSLCLAYRAATGTWTANPGSTAAGSELRPSSVDSDSGGRHSTALSGTWRCLGFASSAVQSKRITLWQRIS